MKYDMKHKRLLENPINLPSCTLAVVSYPDSLCSQLNLHQVCHSGLPSIPVIDYR